MFDEITKLPRTAQLEDAVPPHATVRERPLKMGKPYRCNHPASMIDENTKLCKCVNEPR